jgi:hypothetical protein
MSSVSLRDLVDSRWFALSQFLLIIVSGAILYSFPDAGAWPLLLAVIPWATKVVTTRSWTQFTYSDLLLVIFLLTAAVGSWAAYDKLAAWSKFRLVIAAVLFYYAISCQPHENLGILAGFWFMVGVGISTYFLLTHDFEAFPEKFHIIKQIGLKWMAIRPALQLPGIHPNDASGISIITSVYGLNFLDIFTRTRKNYFWATVILAGLGTACSTILLAASRGAFLALAGAVGVLILWLALQKIHLPLREKVSSLFPYIVIMLMLLVVGILVLTSKVQGGQFSVGENIVVSRLALLQGGISILMDFPLTGGGLGSFPGLYSQYILVIPYYSILHSHNMFLDVMIEQGVIGGLSFLILFFSCTAQLLLPLTRERSKAVQVWYWSAFVSLFVAILHGMVDDYLYGGQGTMLVLFPVGMASVVGRAGAEKQRNEIEKKWYNRLENRRNAWILKNPKQGLLFLILGVILVSGGLIWKKFASLWVSNIGSVRMAKIDLAEYPANRWDEGKRIDELASAQLSLEYALTYDANNRVANYRLGLIKMLGRDFESACDHLEKAYEQDPAHRGVVKNLGYCYGWLGETDKAQELLERIPEAQYELSVYVWWWGEHRRPDLAKKASVILSGLESSSSHDK